MIPVQQFKRGATFCPLCVYQDPPGTPADITGFTLASSIRLKADNSIVATMTALVIDAEAGQFTFNEGTDLWPVGVLIWYIAYLKDGVQSYTYTVQINCQDYVTPPIQ